MRSGNLILVEDEDGLRAVVGQPRRSLRDFVGRYRLVGGSSSILVLERTNTASIEDSDSGRILLAGEIVGADTVLEVVNFIVTSRWIGTLHVYGADAHRVLGIHQGALRFAQSDHPQDRFDKILFRLGAITPAQTEELVRDLGSEQRFGEVLVERGLLTRDEVFGYLKRQMEEVFCAALLENTGSYVFTVSDGETAPKVTGYIQLQELLFHAAERLDRMSEYRQLIPDEEHCPEVAEGVELSALTSRQRLVLGYCDGTKSVREIASETWLGRFETTAAIYNLAREGKVRLAAPSRSLEERAEDLVEPFNEALREILRAAGRNGSVTRCRRELSDWVEDGEYSEYLDGVLDEDGLIDVGRVVSLFRELRVRDRREIVANALHELISFALFTVAMSLPRDRERELAERVNRRLTT